MLNRISQEKFKSFLQISAIIFLGYRIAQIVPDILTISLGTWLGNVIHIIPGVVILLIVTLWNSSPYPIRLRRPRFDNFHISYSRNLLLYTLLIIIISLLAASWIMSGMPSWIMVGQIIFFGSMLLFFVLGMIKPEMGVVSFFVLYPFLWFAEGRLNASLYWLFKDIQYVSDSVQNILIDFHNIDIVMLMFAIGFMLFTINNSRKMEKTVLDKFILLLLVWVFFSVITANDRMVALISYFKKWLFPVIFYYATFLSIKRKNGIREIMIALVVMLFISCLLNFQNTVITGKSAEIEFGAGRAMLWTVIAYQAGPWVVLIFPLAINLLLNRKEVLSIRLLSFFSILLGLIMSIWEMQRAVMGCLIFMLVLWLILYHHKRRWFFVLLPTLGIIVFLSLDKLMELIAMTRPTLLEGNPFSVASNLDRWYLLTQAMDLIKNNPILGVGPGGFRLLHIGYHMPEVSSHNMITEVALESGVMASLLLSIILVHPLLKTIRYFLKNKRSAYEYEDDLRPWVISLLAYYLYLIFGDVWDTGQGVAVFSILGLIMGTNRRWNSCANKG